jgi:hypothetical protein
MIRIPVVDAVSVLRRRAFISREDAMDWIERWFGISPDNGDGSLEALYLVAVAVAAVLLFVAFNARARRWVGHWARVTASHRSAPR